MIGEVAKPWTQDNMQDWKVYRAEVWWQVKWPNTEHRATCKTDKCTGQNYDDRWSGQILNTGQHVKLTSVQDRTMMTGEVTKHWTQGNMQDWQVYRAELWWQVKWSNTEHRTTCKTKTCTGQNYDDRWSGKTEHRATCKTDKCTGQNYDDRWSGKTEHRATCKTDKCTGQNYDQRWSGQTLNTGQHARLTSVQGRAVMIGEVPKHWTQDNM